MNENYAEAVSGSRDSTLFFSHKCSGWRGNKISTAWSHDGQIRRFHCLSPALSQKRRCWELQSSCGTFGFFLFFYFFIPLSQQGHGGPKKKLCLPHLSIIQANAPQPIYNSDTGELIQFIGGLCFLFFITPPQPCFFPPRRSTLLRFHSRHLDHRLLNGRATQVDAVTCNCSISWLM